FGYNFDARVRYSEVRLKENKTKQKQKQSKAQKAKEKNQKKEKIGGAFRSHFLGLQALSLSLNGMLDLLSENTTFLRSSAEKWRSAFYPDRLSTCSTKKNLIKVVTENYQTQFTQLDNLDIEFSFTQLQNRPKYEHKDIRKGRFAAALLSPLLQLVRFYFIESESIKRCTLFRAQKNGNCGSNFRDCKNDICSNLQMLHVL
ncbi:hypothetical protein CMV_022370, partial [Castanea mollissima]